MIGGVNVLISTFFKEDASGLRAEVHKKENGYIVEYYDNSGNLFKSEPHIGKSIHWAESAAENWAKGIKILNG